MADLSNPFVASVIAGVSDAIDPAGYMPVIADAHESHEKLIRILRHFASRRVSGVVTTAAHEGDANVLHDVSRSGVPLVLAIRGLPQTDLPAVVDDDRLGGQLAAEHLVELGHRVLAQLRGPAGIEPVRAREQGFTETAIAYGAEVATVPRASTFSVEDGKRLTEQLFQSKVAKRVTGLFAHSDLMALGAIEWLEASGMRCPDDLSIVGYNDAFFARHTRPPLTTVALPAYEIGRLAGGLILDLIEQRLARAVTTVPPRLIVRASSGPAPKDQ